MRVLCVVSRSKKYVFIAPVPGSFKWRRLLRIRDLRRISTGLRLDKTTNSYNVWTTTTNNSEKDATGQANALSLKFAQISRLPRRIMLPYLVRRIRACRGLLEDATT